jgi:hypothetical protein
MVWWGWTHVETDGNTQTICGGIDRVDYDPAADSWTLADPIKASPRGIHEVFWTGSELVIPAAAPPDGRLLTPRWRVAVGAMVAVGAGHALVSALC